MKPCVRSLKWNQKRAFHRDNDPHARKQIHKGMALKEDMKGYGMD